MGALISCCCPEDDNASNQGDAYGSNTSETTPLLRDGSYHVNPTTSAAGGSGHGHGNGSQFGSEQGEGRSFSDHHFNKSRNHEQLSYHEASSMGNKNQEPVVINEDQQKLAEVLQETMNEVMDCSGVDGRAFPPQILPIVAANNALNGGQNDPSEMQAKAVIYGKKLVQSKKQVKLKATNNVNGLVDVGGSKMGQLNGQSGNDVLNEADHVLACEIANRAHEVVIDHEDLESHDHEECIVPYGKDRAHKKPSGRKT